MFEPYLQRWQLSPDGAPIHTASSHLLPVRYQGIAAMLKIALIEEEQRGARLMQWWQGQGQGAAPVLACADNGLLLERASGPGTLNNLDDEEATRILCTAVTTLHTKREQPLPDLTHLADWFQDLWPAALSHPALLKPSADAARQLLNSAAAPCVLHGDIHHGNILDFGRKGWLAIDPKGLYGERGFDYANLFCNPDIVSAANPQRFEQRLQIVCARAQLPRQRLLQWILAWSGLSAAWFIADAMPEQARQRLKIAALAQATLSPGN